MPTYDMHIRSEHNRQQPWTATDHPACAAGVDMGSICGFKHICLWHLWLQMTHGMPRCSTPGLTQQQYCHYQLASVEFSAHIIHKTHPQAASERCRHTDEDRGLSQCPARRALLHHSSSSSSSAWHGRVHAPVVAPEMHGTVPHHYAWQQADASTHVS